MNFSRPLISAVSFLSDSSASLLLLLQLYEQCVLEWCDLVRKLLIQFSGYECKEPERGKFTLAFESYKNALAFAVTAQEQVKPRTHSHC